MVGGLLLAVTVADLLWTTLWSEGGAGPVTQRVSHMLWSLTRRAAGSGRSGASGQLRSFAGPLILVAVLVTWVVLLYAGWALIFLPAEHGIVSASTRQATVATDRLYFTGYTLFTLGNGEFLPSSAVWQAATVLATANGLVLTTLAITYLVPVVSAATSKRAFAGQVASLGVGAGQLVVRSWGQQGFAGLSPQLVTLSSSLALLGDQHLAYPVLHHFRSRRHDRSSASAVAVLDEALTLLRYGVAEHARPEPAILTPARQTVDSYLETMASAFVAPADTVPAAPRLEVLRHAGIPVVDDDDFAESVADLADRRRRLLGLVQSEGGSWEQIS